jgi:GntP family gluconate:H+ symporter
MIISVLPDWPLVIWMVAATLILGLGYGMKAGELIHTFNAGWGQALGEFALILLPSFTLAAALARHTATGKMGGAASGLAAVTSPFAAASMVCPDTAYAALSPVAGARKTSLAFGAYAGFKLLFPAGPLIVATGLGVESGSLMFYGLALLIPVWVVAVGWVKFWSVSEKGGAKTEENITPGSGKTTNLLIAFTPFIVLAGFLMIGGLLDFSHVPLLDFLTQPKGALIFAAIWSLLSIRRDQRRECIDSAVRRTGSLLLVIGAASAFGAVLTTVIPVGDLVPAQAGLLGIISLFVLTVIFKLAQGSSMATFAAVAPVAAPIVAVSNLPSSAAVFAICLGSFIAILPNDSFYWLVRRDGLDLESEGRAILILAGGATLQALVGLAILLALTALGV